MTDAQARRHVREAAVDDTPVARSRVLVDRLRLGLVTAEHLSVAGWLGDEAARLVVAPWTAPEMSDLSCPARYALSRAPIARTSLVGIAADCAERGLARWEAEHPGDLRPRTAVEAARAWAACPCEDHRRAAAYAAYAYAAYASASAAAYAAAYAAHAAYTAAAAAFAAYAADYAADYADYAADYASASASAEREWQRARTVSVLCGDA